MICFSCWQYQGTATWELFVLIFTTLFTFSLCFGWLKYSVHLILPETALSTRQRDCLKYIVESIEALLIWKIEEKFFTALLLFLKFLHLLVVAFRCIYLSVIKTDSLMHTVNITPSMNYLFDEVERVLDNQFHLFFIRNLLQSLNFLIIRLVCTFV